ncbi:hypothetical protein ACJ5NV_16945 [Loktanella agnita]|uniref:hypothetical protein n=1 Tax=Loktanella agnita TaxID=287097 RepID=UPI00398997AF
MSLLRFATLILTFSVTSAAAMGACLPGTWDVDGQQLADTMGAQMGGTATYQGGSVSLEISDSGEMLMRVDDLIIATQIPGAPAMPVTINGMSSASLTADDGENYVAEVSDYALLGSAEMMGTRMDIPVTSAGGAGWGESRGTYRCTDDTLTFEPTEPGSIPPSWRRVL